MRAAESHRVWCPKYQVTELHRLLNHNRGAFGCEVIGGCLGGRCGAWAWDDDENGNCGFINQSPKDKITVDGIEFPTEIKVSNMDEFKVIVENAFAEPDEKATESQF